MKMNKIIAMAIGKKILPSEESVIRRKLALVPLVKRFQDQNGVATQVWWDAKQGVVGTVTLADGTFKILASRQIINGLTGNSLDDATIDRLRSGKPEGLIAVYKSATKVLEIWPKLMAAGLGDNPRAREIRSQGFQEHHIIPRELLSSAKPEYANARSLLNDAGFNVNQTSNTMFLPTGAADTAGHQSRSIHRGYHKPYTDDVADRLGDIYKDTKDKSISADQKRDQITQVMNDLRKELRGGDNPLNNAVDHSDAAKISQAQNQLTSTASVFANELAIQGLDGGGAPQNKMGGVGVGGGKPHRRLNRAERRALLGMDSMADWFMVHSEPSHYFALPVMADGQMPCTDAELQEIIRVLTRGIYGTGDENGNPELPWVSLDFSSDKAMISTLHPVYRHTIVGHVIGWLDYWMKGFLNGGIYDEAYVNNWAVNGGGSVDSNAIIGLRQYLKAQHLDIQNAYWSLRERMAILGIENMELGAVFGQDGTVSNKIFTSFRLIFNEKAFHKLGKTFMLDGDFEVKYRIEMTPAMLAELARVKKETGVAMPEWKKLIDSYEAMAKDVKAMMPKIPMFQKYFQMAHIINFLCYYLQNLKLSNRFPVLAPAEGVTKFFPVAVPTLPVARIVQCPITVTISELMNIRGIMPDQLADYIFKNHDRISLASADRPLSLDSDDFSDLPADLSRGLTTYFKEKSQRTLGHNQERLLSDDDTLLTVIVNTTIQKLCIMVTTLITNRESLLAQLAQSQTELVAKFESDYQTINGQTVNASQIVHDKIQVSLQDRSGYIIYGATFAKRYQDAVDRMKLYQDLIKNIDLIDQAKCKKELEFVRAQVMGIDQEFQSLENELKSTGNRIYAGTSFSYSRNGCYGVVVIGSIRDDQGCAIIDIGDAIRKINAEFDQNKAAAITQLNGEKANVLAKLEKQQKFIESFDGDLRDWALDDPPISIPIPVRKTDTAYNDATQSIRLIGGCSMGVMPPGPNTHHPDNAELATLVDAIPAGPQSWEPVALSSGPHAVCRIDHELVLPDEFASQIIEAGLNDSGESTGGGFTEDQLALVARILDPKLTSAESMLAGQPLDTAARDHYGNSILHFAVLAKKTEIIRRWKATGVFIMPQNEMKITPAHVAAQMGWTAGLEILGVTRGTVQSMAYAINGATALHVAAENGHLETVQYLVTINMRINAQRSDFATPLLLALMGHHWEVAKFLIGKGADVSLALHNGQTALHLAAEYGNLDVISTMMTIRGVKIDVQRRDQLTPIMVAAMNGYLDIVKLLAGRNASLTIKTDEGLTIFHMAAKAGQSAVMRWLMANNPEQVCQAVEKDNLIEFAIRHGQFETAKVILEGVQADFTSDQRIQMLTVLGKWGLWRWMEGLNPTADALADLKINDLPLGHAAAAIDGYWGFWKAFRANPEICRQATDDGDTPLNLAIRNGAIRTWELILQLRPPTDTDLGPLQPDAHGWYPIHKAIWFQYMDGIRRWIQHTGRNGQVGDIQFPLANANRRFENGRTVGYLACLRGNLEVVKLILNEMVKRNISFTKAWGSRHLLYGALKSRNPAVIDWVLNHEAPDLPKEPVVRMDMALDDRGTRPGHLLARTGDPSLITYGVKRGCQFLEVDKSGLDGVEIMLRSKFDDGILALYAAGNDLSVPLNSIVRAARWGRNGVIQHLLTRYLDIDAVGPDGMTAVHAAVMGRYPDTIHLLAHLGADLNRVNAQGNTPLQAAISLGYSDCVQVLIAATGISADPGDRADLIQRAVQSGDPDTVRILLDAGCQLPTTGVTRNSNLAITAVLTGQWADYENRVKLIVEAIMKQQPFSLDGIAPNQSYQGRGGTVRAYPTPLLAIAIAAQNIDAINTLITAGASVDQADENGIYPIHLVAATGNLAILELAKAAGMELNRRDSEGRLPIHYAAMQGRLEMVKALTTGPITEISDYMGNTPLLSAVIGKHRDVVDYLIPLSDIHHYNQLGLTPVMLAAAMGEVEMTELLIQSGADPNYPCGPDRQTLAHIVTSAEWEPHLDKIIQWNLKGLPDANGEYPLHIAAKKGLFGFLGYYLNREIEEMDFQQVFPGRVDLPMLGVRMEPPRLPNQIREDSVNKPDENGWTPLHWALNGRHSDMAKILVRHGASANPLPAAKSDSENLFLKKNASPVMIAAHCGDLEMVKWLIEMGADVDAKDAKNQDILAYAAMGGNVAVVSWLLATYLPDARWTRIQNAHRFNLADAYEIAIRMDAADVVALLITKFPESRDDKITIFPPLSSTALAVTSGSVESLIALATAGADRTSSGKQSSLELAIQSGKSDVLPVLLELGADRGDPQAVDGALTEAIHTQDLGALTTVAMRYFQMTPAEGGQSFIKLALRTGYFAGAKRLWVLGGMWPNAGSDTQDPSIREFESQIRPLTGLPPIHRAWRMDPSLVPVMIQSRIPNITATNSDGQTIVDLAQSANRVDILDLMIRCHGGEIGHYNDEILLRRAFNPNHKRQLKVMLRGVSGRQPLDWLSIFGSKSEAVLSKALSQNRLRPADVDAVKVWERLTGFSLPGRVLAAAGHTRPSTNDPYQTIIIPGILHAIDTNNIAFLDAISDGIKAELTNVIMEFVWNLLDRQSPTWMTELPIQYDKISNYLLRFGPAVQANLRHLFVHHLLLNWYYAPITVHDEWLMAFVAKKIPRKDILIRIKPGHPMFPSETFQGFAKMLEFVMSGNSNPSNVAQIMDIVAGIFQDYPDTRLPTETDATNHLIAKWAVENCHLSLYYGVERYLLNCTALRGPAGHQFLSRLLTKWAQNEITPEDESMLRSVVKNIPQKDILTQISSGGLPGFIAMLEFAISRNSNSSTVSQSMDILVGLLQDYPTTPLSSATAQRVTNWAVKKNHIELYVRMHQAADRVKITNPRHLSQFAGAFINNRHPLYAIIDQKNSEWTKWALQYFEKDLYLPEKDSDDRRSIFQVLRQKNQIPADIANATWPVGTASKLVDFVIGSIDDKILCYRAIDHYIQAKIYAKKRSGCLPVRFSQQLDTDEKFKIKCRKIRQVLGHKKFAANRSQIEPIFKKTAFKYYWDVVA